jgi:ABC-type Fe3+-hydroxamate transport system substrate-binding protein
MLSMFLCIAIIFLSPGHTQANAPLYMTLGPEAPAILRMLISEDQVLPVTAMHLAGILQDRSITAVIVPEEWLDDSQLAMVRASGVQLVLIKRHTTVANVLDNIRTLAALTGTEAIGDTWIKTIEQRISVIQQEIVGNRPTRVLILTPEGYTQGQGALITELIDITGGINVAAEAGIPEARQIDDQQVRTFAPEVILLINWSADDAAEFAHNALLATVPAFRLHHLYRIASPGKDPARLIEDLWMLVDLLHPLLF